VFTSALQDAAENKGAEASATPSVTARAGVELRLFSGTATSKPAAEAQAADAPNETANTRVPLTQK